MKLSEVIILVIGDRVWGTGKTLNEAVEKCKTIGGRNSVKKYIAYLAEPGTTVNGMSWFYKKEAPVEFHRHGFPKEKKKDVVQKSGRGKRGAAQVARS